MNRLANTVVRCCRSDFEHVVIVTVRIYVLTLVCHNSSTPDAAVSGKNVCMYEIDECAVMFSRTQQCRAVDVEIRACGSIDP